MFLALYLMRVRVELLSNIRESIHQEIVALSTSSKSITNQLGSESNFLITFKVVKQFDSDPHVYFGDVNGWILRNNKVVWQVGGKNGILWCGRSYGAQSADAGGAASGRVCFDGAGQPG